MARATLVCLLLVAAIAYCSAFPQNPQEPDTCGPNEEFKTCGTACEDKCGMETPPICTLKCVIGCQCKEGFRRDNDNRCVLTRDCPEA